MSVTCMMLVECCCSDYVAHVGVAENGKLNWCCSGCVAQMMLRRLSSDGISVGQRVLLRVVFAHIGGAQILVSR